MILDNDDYYKMNFLIHTLDEETLKKMIYIFSNTNFKFPDKDRIFNIDRYIEMAKLIEYQGMTFNKVAHIFNKSISFVENVYMKYRYFILQ